MFLFLKLSYGGAYVSRVWTFGIGAHLTNFELTLLLVSEIPRHFCLQRTELRTRMEPVEILIGCFPLLSEIVVEGWPNSRDKFTFLLVTYTTSHWTGPRCSLIGSGSSNAKSFGGSSDFHHHNSSHFHNLWRYRLYSYCSVNTYYWSPVDLLSSSCVNFATFLIFTERKCHICDIIYCDQ
jgi:hypothetical protein